MNERGGALVACILLALLLMASVLWFTQWSMSTATAKVHQMSSQNAMTYADSGVSDVQIRLKSPAINQFLPIGGTTTYSLAAPSGRVDIALSRPLADVNLVDAYATGYYFLSKGSFVDPQTGQKAQMASVNAKFEITNVGQFLAAVPTTLTIGYGTSASNGMVYGNNLVFDGCSPSPCSPPPYTQVSAAYYFQSVSPSSAPAFVQFGSSSYAQQFSYPMNFASLDSTMEAYYQSQGAPPGQYPTSFDGTVSAPNNPNKNVYYYQGPVNIAQNSPLTVQGVYVIYATGDVTIYNNIAPADANSWVAILSEGNIHLANNAPANLTLNGSFVCNGQFVADTPSIVDRTGGTLSVNGGIVSMIGISVANGWPTRTYTYQSLTNFTNLVLPNFSEQLQYHIVQGKYD